MLSLQAYIERQRQSFENASKSTFIENASKMIARLFSECFSKQFFILKDETIEQSGLVLKSIVLQEADQTKCIRINWFEGFELLKSVYFCDDIQTNTADYVLYIEKNHINEVKGWDVFFQAMLDTYTSYLDSKEIKASEKYNIISDGRDVQNRKVYMKMLKCSGASIPTLTEYMDGQKQKKEPFLSVLVEKFVKDDKIPELTKEGLKTASNTAINISLKQEFNFIA